jgi:hypothetical protein
LRRFARQLLRDPKARFPEEPVGEADRRLEGSAADGYPRLLSVPDSGIVGH